MIVKKNLLCLLTCCLLALGVKEKQATGLRRKVVVSSSHSVVHGKILFPLDEYWKFDEPQNVWMSQEKNWSHTKTQDVEEILAPMRIPLTQVEFYETLKKTFRLTSLA